MSACKGTDRLLSQIDQIRTSHIRIISSHTDWVGEQKGSQVAPAELEDLLLGHESIADVAVTAIPRPEEATEVPRAYGMHRMPLKQLTMLILLDPLLAQLQPGVQANEAEARKILDWANAKLADWKRLRGGLVFVDGEWSRRQFGESC